MTKPFKPMKAAKHDDVEAFRYPVLASPKIDGFRAVKIKGEDKLLAYSLKPFPNPHVQELFGRPQLDGFDGEITVGRPNAPDVVQRTAETMRKYGKPDVYFHVFDDFSNPDLSAADRQTVLQLRLAELREMYGDEEWINRVKLVTQTVLTDDAELEDYESRALKAGFEGVMTRDPQAAYKYGRSTGKEQIIVKVKRFTDAEAYIAGFSEAQENTNTAVRNALGHIERSSHKAGMVGKGMVGTIHVYDFNGPDGARREFDIGPGTLPHSMREALWTSYQLNPGTFEGQAVTYKFFKHGEKDVPRHGGFLRFRDPLDMDV